MTPVTERAASKLARAHARFAKASLFVYLGAASVAVVLLVAALVTDRTFDDEQTQGRLLLETQVRAHYLGQHLALLVAELHRLGMRSEINLLDHDMRPERSLLELSHSHSTFFNLGVAILDRNGLVLWALPHTFLPTHTDLGTEPWFEDETARHRVAIVPVDPQRASDSVVYVVSPIIRNQMFTGALVGGVDLARGSPIAGSAKIETTVLATARGTVVYPPRPPDFAGTSEWANLFSSAHRQPFTSITVLGNTTDVVASAPIALGKLRLLTLEPRDRLFAGAAHRMRTRLALGLTLELLPLAALVLMLMRSFSEFRRAEEEAVREEQLSTIGAAANLIAHEVRNSLNGIRMGLDLVLRGGSGPELPKPASKQVVRELRAEIERLGGFTHQLMLFAKDPTPRSNRIDLAQLVPRALSLTQDLATELGVEVEIRGADQPHEVDADPALLHMILSNLVSNALDALAAREDDGPARLVVELEQRGDSASITVTDNGPGVPADVETTLFEPFVTGKPSGVGLGLALARKIARAHGGDLSLVATDVGACFRLELPLPGTRST